MSSTPAVGTPTHVASSVSFEVPSPSSISPTYTPPPSSRVNTVSLITSATISPTAATSASVISAYLEQSQQPSSPSQISMAVTIVTATSVPSSACSSTVTLASGISSSMSSISFMITTTSRDDSQSATPTRATTITPPTTVVTGPIQTSTSPLPSFATTTHDAVTSPASISTSTSNTRFNMTSLPLPSDPPSPTSSAGRIDIPLTTVLEGTTIFITSTNSQGQVVKSIPPVVTEVITTTGTGGIATTVTQAIVNPSLAPNNSTAENLSFFTNTGAVVGVFVIVGLAGASIMMWILFAIRHRQKTRPFGQNAAIEAAIAATVLNRAPLDEDDEGDSPTSPDTFNQLSSEMDQRSTFFGLGGSTSLPTSAQLPEVVDGTIKDRENSHPKGYVPARTMSPSPRAERCTDLGSSCDRKSSYGHTPTYSAGSFEPLLANYVQNMPDQDTAFMMQLPQPHSPPRLGNDLAFNGYSSEGSSVDPPRPSSKRQNSSDSYVSRERGDTRYVLMESVRHSQI